MWTTWNLSKARVSSLRTRTSRAPAVAEVPSRRKPQLSTESKALLASRAFSRAYVGDSLFFRRLLAGRACGLRSNPRLARCRRGSAGLIHTGLIHTADTLICIRLYRSLQQSAAIGAGIVDE